MIAIALWVLAQDDWEVPTLSRDLGLHFENPDASIVFDVSGRQKITLFVIPDEGATNVKKNGSLFYPTTDLFVDGTAFDRVTMFLDVRMDRGIPPQNGGFDARVESWWIRYEVPIPVSLFAQAGKFASPIGNFIPRHDTPQDVLPFRPLPYVTVTNFKPTFTQAQLLASRNLPRLDRYGRMLIWEEVYASGVLLFGTEGPFHYRLAVTNNATSGPPKWWDFNNGDEGNRNASGFFGFTPWIWLKLGVSFSTGPYLHKGETAIGAGRSDLFHDMVGASAEASYGHWAAYFEFFHHAYEAANISRDLLADSWYLELQYKIQPGLAAGVRLARNTFSSLGGVDWDHTSVRVEGGVRWTVLKGLVVRGELMITDTTGHDPDDFMSVLQILVFF